MGRSKKTAGRWSRTVNRRIARGSWRAAVLAEAQARLGTDRFTQTLRARFDLLEEAIEVGIESGVLEYAPGDEAAPFDVEDGALLLIGPRPQARRAARALFGTDGSKNGYLDTLLDKPAMVDSFTFSDGSK